MPRLPRFLPPDNVFHIMCRGNNGGDIFHSSLDYLKYLELIGRFKSDHPFDLFHYCLMTNHTHLLVRVRNGADFSIFMKKLNLGYFKHYQKEYGWRGHFWQDRFKSKLITQDIYLVQCGKYIELNPVRAGIIEKPEEYIWSSYNYYALGKANHLVERDMFYDELGKSDQSRQEAYTDMVVDEIFSFDNKSVAQGKKEDVYNANRRFNYHQEHKDSAYRK